MAPLNHLIFKLLAVCVDLYVRSWVAEHQLVVFHLSSVTFVFITYATDLRSPVQKCGCFRLNQPTTYLLTNEPATNQVTNQVTYQQWTNNHPSYLQTTNNQSTSIPAYQPTKTNLTTNQWTNNQPTHQSTCSILPVCFNTKECLFMISSSSE